MLDEAYSVLCAWGHACRSDDLYARPLRNALNGQPFSECLLALHEEGGKLRKACVSGCRAEWMKP